MDEVFDTSIEDVGTWHQPTKFVPGVYFCRQGERVGMMVVREGLHRKVQTIYEQGIARAHVVKGWFADLFFIDAALGTVVLVDETADLVLPAFSGESWDFLTAHMDVSAESFLESYGEDGFRRVTADREWLELAGWVIRTHGDYYRAGGALVEQAIEADVSRVNFDRLTGEEGS
jgi:hypothetical protein